MFNDDTDIATTLFRVGFVFSKQVSTGFGTRQLVSNSSSVIYLLLE